MNNIICNSGGATGSDTFFENFCILFGIKINHFSYKTKYHKSEFKVEISEEDFNEGIEMVKKSSRFLKRYNYFKYINLLARNWCQVKYSEEIYAIGNIINNGVNYVVDGGTGWACTMSILSNKPLYVFDQNKKSWFKWSYTINNFSKLESTPLIKVKSFAGIGTREINEFGINAIKELINNSFNKKQ